jgi:hypothetical protein
MEKKKKKEKARGKKVKVSESESVLLTGISDSFPMSAFTFA